MPRPGFIIGLDLGTTNSTLSFIDTLLGGVILSQTQSVVSSPAPAVGP